MGGGRREEEERRRNAGHRLFKTRTQHHRMVGNYATEEPHIHRFNLCGSIADAQHMWMMLAAAALLIPSATPATPQQPDADSGRTRCGPPMVSRKCHAC